MRTTRLTRRTRLTKLARLSAVPAAALMTMGLAACGGDDVGPKPSLPTETPALFNPCDGLDVAGVQKALGSTVALTMNDGTPTSPACNIAPPKGTNQPALTATYALFDGSLEDYFSRLGTSKTATVTEPTIAGADATRLVVSAEKDQILMTGFVQTGQLFQVINVVDPTPYDRTKLVTGIEQVMTDVVAHARSTGAGKPPAASSSDASPTG